MKSQTTWNYVAVHIYGVPKLIVDHDGKVNFLKKLQQQNDNSNWTVDQVDKDYLEKQLHGIQVFEIKITKIEPKFKLSQNRNENDQQAVIQELTDSVNHGDNDVGYLMKELKEKNNNNI